MTPDYANDVPPFPSGGLIWRSWVVDSGTRYVWKADGTTLSVGRIEGTYFAADGPTYVRWGLPSLVAAMRTSAMLWQQASEACDDSSIQAVRRSA